MFRLEVVLIMLLVMVNIAYEYAEVDSSPLKLEELSFAKCDKLTNPFHV